MFPRSAPPAELVEDDCQDDHHPDGDELPEGRHVQDDQAELDGGDDQGADQGAEDRPSAAEEASPADDHGRD